MFKYFALLVSVAFSQTVHAITEPTPNLPLSIQNISGNWTCRMNGVNKDVPYIELTMRYQTEITSAGIEHTPEMTMEIFVNDMRDIAPSVYQIKSNAVGLYSLDENQLSTRVISGNVTKVTLTEGLELIPAAIFKKGWQDSIKNDTKNKVKTKINTSKLTSNVWKYTTEDEGVNFSTACFK